MIVVVRFSLDIRKMGAGQEMGGRLHSPDLLQILEGVFNRRSSAV